MGAMNLYETVPFKHLRHFNHGGAVQDFASGPIDQGHIIALGGDDDNVGQRNIVGSAGGLHSEPAGRTAVCGPLLATTDNRP